MFKSKRNVIACFTVLAFALSCSDSSSDSNSEFVVGETIPSDSTGKSSSMNVNFASLQSMGLTLTNAATLAIGTDIELSYAKFNVAKIRVKALKEQSADEKTLETMESSEETASVKEVEAETGTDAASLVDKGDKTTKEKGADRAAKIAEKAAKLEAKEKAAIAREASRDKATKWNGPFVFDAIAGKLEGDAPQTTLVDGSYRRVEFQLKRNFSAAAEEAILGNVFAMRGTILKGGVKVPFEIDWHVALNFRLAGEGAMTVKAGEENAMIVDFNLAKWFEGIDLTAAAVDADGTIYINKSTNKTIMKQLHSNIKLNSRFGKDVDADKVLDESEKAGAGEAAADATVE